MRYLIATLIAVFLALGVGILIGLELDSDGIVWQQQSQLLASIDGVFADLIAANRQLAADLKTAEQDLLLSRELSVSLTDLYSASRLPGLTVALIETGDHGGADYVKSWLATTGSGTDLAITITDYTKTLSADQHPALHPAGICQAIATALAGGDVSDALWLADLGLLKLRGILGPVPDYVVVIAGDDHEEKLEPPLDFFLATALKQTGIPTLAAESSDTRDSMLPYYQRSQIPTVDNIDTNMGQAALKLLMSGSAGHFGVQPVTSAQLSALGAGGLP